MKEINFNATRGNINVQLKVIQIINKASLTEMLYFVKAMISQIGH